MSVESSVSYDLYFLCFAHHQMIFEMSSSAALEIDAQPPRLVPASRIFHFFSIAYWMSFIIIISLFSALANPCRSTHDALHDMIACFNKTTLKSLLLCKCWDNSSSYLWCCFALGCEKGARIFDCIYQLTGLPSNVFCWEIVYCNNSIIAQIKWPYQLYLPVFFYWQHCIVF